MANKRLLVLSKRQYTGKDLLTDRFGRCWELPRELAKLGYSVTGVALSYRKRDAGKLIERHSEGRGELEWYSINLGRGVIAGLTAYFRLIYRIIRARKPLAIMAMSDALHIILGRFFARRFGIKLVVDLYDNFESFGVTRLPGVRWAYRSSLENADAVICVSDELRKLMRVKYSIERNVVTIENAANEEWFRPMSQESSREFLDLPFGKRLIGTAGALSNSRDIDTLFRATEILVARNPDIELVVAGPRDRFLVWPKNVKVHDLGLMSQKDVAVLFNALDVAIVCNLDSKFGRYCFPQKLVEMLACNVPIVSARIGAASELLAHYPQILYPPGDVRALVDSVEAQLQRPVRPNTKLPGWGGLAVSLESELTKLGII